MNIFLGPLPVGDVKFKTPLSDSFLNAGMYAGVYYTIILGMAAVSLRLQFAIDIPRNINERQN